VYLLLCRIVEMQNTKKVHGGETKRKKKDESSGIHHMSPQHAEFMREYTYGRIVWITSSTNKKIQNYSRRRKQRCLKNRMKLESTLCLL
jgi:hypothetical protein